MLLSDRWQPWVLAAAILLQLLNVRAGLYPMMLRSNALFFGILIASYDSDYIGAALGALKKPMLWICSRSYAIYLIHIPAYLLTRESWFHIEPEGIVFDSAYTLKYLATCHGNPGRPKRVELPLD